MGGGCCLDVVRREAEGERVGVVCQIGQQVGAQSGLRIGHLKREGHALEHCAHQGVAHGRTAAGHHREAAAGSCLYGRVAGFVIRYAHHDVVERRAGIGPIGGHLNGHLNLIVRLDEAGSDADYVGDAGRDQVNVGWIDPQLREHQVGIVGGCRQVQGDRGVLRQRREQPTGGGAKGRRWRNHQRAVVGDAPGGPRREHAKPGAAHHAHLIQHASQLGNTRLNW